MSLAAIQKLLRAAGSKSQAKILQRFFKTGPGQYGEGDRFLGAKVPAIRKLAKDYQDLPQRDVETLLISAIHEERLLALIMLVIRFQKSDDRNKQRIYALYLKRTAFINNWDLVDLSAEHIVGAYLLNRSRRPLHTLAKSKSLWERRIAIMATFHFLKHGDYEETLGLATFLLRDEHDLIHKAVGWMLREVGNRDRNTEECFLKKHYADMPRTMLRYAIEKFPESRRQQYLKGKV